MSFSYPQIILFGDSLTQLSFCPSKMGIGAQLAHSYARKADVQNRGVSGYNSRWLFPLFRQTLRQLSPASKVLLYVIWVGTNDACLPEYPHHVPLDEFQQNLRSMISEIRAHTHTKNTKILVISPPPIYIPLLRTKGPREGKDRDYSRTKQYAYAALEVVNEFYEDVGIASINLHSLIESLTFEGCALEEESGSDIRHATDGVFTDGLHLDYKGYDCLYQEVVRILNAKWPEITPEKTPLTAPWWGDLVM